MGPSTWEGPMSRAEGRDGSEEQDRDTRQEPGPIEEFVASLTPEERLLVRLKAELYEGSWDELVADLEARLHGRPYILKLATRIEDDLARIDRLRRSEVERRINLEDFC